MRIANYFLSGELASPDFVQWLSEEIGLYGSTEAARIVVHINSPGGDLMIALQAVNLMRSSPIPITTIVNGSAESAALLILMAGHKRAAFTNSFGMAHHLSTTIEGNYHTLKDSIKQIDMIQAAMLSIYKEFTNLDEMYIRQMLLGRGDTFLDSSAMLRYGMVDEIIEPGPQLHEFIKG